MAGRPVHLAVDRPTLVVAVKPDCDGCREFIEGDLEELGGLRVVPVARDDGAGEWARARREVVVAPELLDELDVRWPPFYVLLGPGRQLLAEGVVFGPAQVAAEVAPYLA